MTAASGAGLAVFGNNSVATINGATVTGNSGFGLDVDAGGLVTVNGGTLSGLYALAATNGGTILVHGGTFSGTSGLPSSYGLLTYGSSKSVIDLFGVFTGYNNGDTITYGSGTINGILSDGQAISTTYLANGGTIEFSSPAAVPELSSAGSLGLCLLGLGVLVGTRKRQVRGAAQP